MKYCKKPIVIEAFLWTADINQTEDPEWIVQSIKEGRVSFPSPLVLQIHTLEGTMQANVGDYIIKGVKGELYPCKPDIFETTYEKVED